jgi:hypothetical protein
VVEDGIDVWLTWGNHDIESTRRMNSINERFDAPRWTSHSWGDLDVIILDSNQVDSTEQRQFFMDEMARSNRPKIVVFHHPAHSCSRHGDTKSVLESWVPLFDKDVVLVLNGHDHNYQHFSSEGVEYVVTGGGGRKLYGLDECPNGHPEQISAAEEFHFLSIEQSPQILRIQALDVNGNTIDSFEIDLGPR